MEANRNESDLFFILHVSESRPEKNPQRSPGGSSCTSPPIVCIINGFRCDRANAARGWIGCSRDMSSVWSPSQRTGGGWLAWNGGRAGCLLRGVDERETGSSGRRRCFSAFYLIHLAVTRCSDGRLAAPWGVRPLTCQHSSRSDRSVKKKSAPGKCRLISFKNIYIFQSCEERETSLSDLWPEAFALTSFPSLRPTSTLSCFLTSKNKPKGKEAFKRTESNKVTLCLKMQKPDRR